MNGGGDGGRVRARVGLYAATSALGSYLLFTLELLVGRLLLPRLGGSPGAWNTALVFFQVALLAGYAWAGAGRRVGPAAHRVAQLVLVLAGAALLPVALPGSWVPSTDAPALSTLGVLTVRIALPFVALATTGPLLQVWATTWLPAGREPYGLYAAGNLGSLAALAAYPTVVEPSLGLHAQARWWSAGYALFLALLAACAVLARLDRGAAPAGAAASVAWRDRLAWAGLAAVPSALLLGVTRHLTVDVAPVALLWVLPLAAYLGSFVVAFATRRPRWVRPVAGALSAASALAVAVSVSGTPRLVGQLMVLHLAAFTCACVAAHCWLADRRPPVAALGSFYLWLAVGGAAGGVAVAVAAPLVFDRVTEYPLALAAAAAIGVGALGRRRLVVTTALAAAGGLAVHASMRTFHGWVPVSQALLAGVAAAVVGAAVVRRPRVAAVALVPAVLWAAHDPREVRWRERTLFGVYRVTVNARGDHVLGVGTTIHGVQRWGEGDAERRRPMAYYHPTTPIGHWFYDHQQSGPRRVGVIGLGIGGMAAWGRPGDRFDFYEIDPVMVDLARDRELFTYLADSQATIDIAVGDGRRELQERPDARYDLLLADAFGSDAVPTHLLTVEALRLYLDRLAPGGTLALHLSNRSLDLVPVVARLADELGLVGLVSDGTPSQFEEADGAFASTVALLARRQEDLGLTVKRSTWRPLAGERRGSLWTDDRIDVLDALQ